MNLFEILPRSTPLFVAAGTLNSAADEYCALELDCIVRLITPDGMKTCAAPHEICSEIQQRSQSLHPSGFVLYILGHNKDTGTNLEKNTFVMRRLL